MVLNRTVRRANSPGYSATVLTVKAVLRRSRGGAQSVLVRASDGFLYWVKLLAGLQGPNALANEVLGNELARYLGISVLNWSPIEFTKDSLETSPLCWPEPGSGLPRPSPGIYFASRAVGLDEEEAIYEILPGEWLNRISNRDDFIGMLTLDVWTNQVGSRRAVFVPSKDKSLITTVFIENSQMFGGFWGNEVQHRGRTLYPDYRVYSSAGLSRAFDRWINKIAAIDETLIHHLARFVPHEWRVPSHLKQVVSMLRTRQRHLKHLLALEVKLIDESMIRNTSPSLIADKLPDLSVGQILDGWKTETLLRERHRGLPARRRDDRNHY